MHRWYSINKHSLVQYKSSYFVCKQNPARNTQNCATTFSTSKVSPLRESNMNRGNHLSDFSSVRGDFAKKNVSLLTHSYSILLSVLCDSEIIELNRIAY